MDVALNVAELRDDDARRPQDRRGHPGRDPRATRSCTTSTSARGTTRVSRRVRWPGSTCSRSRASTRTTARRSRSRTSPSRWARSRSRSSAATAWARRRCATRSWGCSPPRATGSVRFDGQELVGRPSYKIAGGASATSRRGGGCSRRSRSTSTCGCSARHGDAASVDVASASTSSSRASPSASATAARSSPAASSRCSRSGARCSTNPELLIMDEPSEGLAPTIVEDLVETFQHARGGGHRDPAGRAEPRRGDRARGAPARHGRRQDRGRDDRRGARDAELQRRYLGVEPLATRLHELEPWGHRDHRRSSLPARSLLLLASGAAAPDRLVRIVFVAPRQRLHDLQHEYDEIGERHLTDAGVDLSSQGPPVPDSPAWSPVGSRSRSRRGAGCIRPPSSMTVDSTGPAPDMVDANDQQPTR